MTKKPTTIDEYITGFTPDVQQILKKIRTTIRKVAPKAEESISYGVPAFKLHGPLIYFAAFKNHIGVYPVTAPVRANFKELSKYKGGKGTVKFPLDEPIPYPLIGRIVKFKMSEQRKKASK
jgi:uncharacterized protein YdhG (YjbR/CyaY superfamily)